MTPPQDGYQIAGMFMRYFGRMLLLAGVGIVLVALILHVPLWILGVVVLVVSLFMMAIGYALSLPA